MKYFLNILVVVVSVAVLSCDSSDNETPRNNNFFPLKTGVYQIYDVKEIIYTLGDPDTFRYELKTVVVDSFENSNGGHTYVIHRSKKPEGAWAWTYLDSWSAVNDGSELIVNEENIPYLKLKFPASLGKTWDGNIYNNITNPSSNQHVDIYKIAETGKSLQLGDVSLGEYIRVEQEDNQEFIVYFDKRNEIYAVDVGLVYREIEQLQYCTSNDCLGDQVVQTGVIYKQTIIAYGEE